MERELKILTLQICDKHNLPPDITRKILCEIIGPLKHLDVYWKRRIENVYKHKFSFDTVIFKGKLWKFHKRKRTMNITLNNYMDIYTSLKLERTIPEYLLPYLPDNVIIH